MTSVSSSSSSTSASTSASSQQTTPQTAMAALLMSSGFLSSLSSSGSSSKPTTGQVLTTLWSLINPDNAKTITKADVQQAVTTLGGTASVTSAIWAKISPYGLKSVSQSSFESNAFLTSSVNSNMATIQSSYSSFINSSAGIAGKAMTLLMTSNDMVSALSTNTSTYVPPTTTQMLSTLWAMLDVNSAKSASKSNVEQAVVNEGGTATEADALWSQITQKGASDMSTAQFLSDPFVLSAITANTSKVQADVAKYQLANMGTSKSVLDQFSSGGADILSGAASGYNDSPVGGGDTYTNYTNLFV